MARSERLDYPGAVALFSEIRASDGWTCKHGYHDGHIGIWLERKVAPWIKPTFVDQRDSWLWLRDMYESMVEEGSVTQAPLPMASPGYEGGPLKAGEAPPTRAKGQSDLRRLADSHSEGERR